MERLKTIIAYHPEDHNRSLEIQVIQRERMSVGMESKERIKGKITSPSGERQRCVQLIRRNFDDRFPYNTRDNLRIAQQTQDEWKKYKVADLPTYDTLRLAQDGSLLTTDESAFGARTYGNPDFRYSLKEGKIFRTRKDKIIDEQFIKLASEPMDKIRQESDRIVDIASQNRIGLPLNDPLELIVNPDGKWQIKTLDVAESHTFDFIENAERFNKECTEYFMNQLIWIKNELISYYEMNVFKRYGMYFRYRLKQLKKKTSYFINYGRWY